MKNGKLVPKKETIEFRNVLIKDFQFGLRLAPRIRFPCPLRDGG